MAYFMLSSSGEKSFRRRFQKRVSSFRYYVSKHFLTFPSLGKQGNVETTMSANW